MSKIRLPLSDNYQLVVKQNEYIEDTHITINRKNDQDKWVFEQVIHLRNDCLSSFIKQISRLEKLLILK